MISKPFQFLIGALLMGAAAIPAVFFGFERSQLQRRLTRQRDLTRVSQRLEEENRSLQDLLAKTSGDAASAATNLRADLAAARHELADLESHARERRREMVAQASSAASELANNRDLRRGLVRLEYFEEAGQATPEAAFQSLAAAMLRDRPDRLGELYVLSPSARQKAEAFIAGLPEEARAKWSPEKLGELFLSGALTSVSALQITDVRARDARHVMLVFRIPGAKDEPKLPMELGPDGWRVQVDERGIDVVRKHVSQAQLQGGERPK